MGKVVKAAVGIGLFFVGGGSGALIARSIGANLLLGEAARLLGPKPPRRVMRPQTVTESGTVMPGAIIYGDTRTSGMRYIPGKGTSGSGGKYLHYIIVLACHEVEEIGAVWFDDKKIETTDLDVNGNVTSGDFAGKALIEKYTGAADQTACTTLVNAFTEWTVDFRGRGIAYMHIRLERDDEVYKNGPPRNFYAQVKGRKVYDPRNGTTAWSDNPALCVRDYLTSYCSATTNDTLVAAAANICDESVTTPDGTEKRFVCNGVLSTGEEPAQNVSDLLSSMNGAATFSGGNFRVFAGAYDAPTHTIDESWLAGDVKLQIGTPGSKLYNIVRTEYIDPERNWQVQEAEPQTAASYVTQDGRELELALSLPFVDNEYQAQRLAYYTLLHSRGQRVLDLTLNLKALDLNVWDTATITLPDLGVNEVYRILSWQYTDGGAIQVTARQESSAYYAEPSYTAKGTVGALSPLASSPDAPNSLTTEPTLGGVHVRWTSPPSRQYDVIEVWRSNDNVLANASLRATVRGNYYFDPTPTGTTFYYWVRARNIQGAYSEWMPPSDGAPGSGSSVPSGSLEVTLNSTYLFVAQDNGTAASLGPAIAYAANGSTPYTYSWTRVSGSTDITADSASASSTDFSVVAGTNEVKSAVFKCTVTDSASPEVVVDSPNVTVTAQFTTLIGGGTGGGSYVEP